MHISPKGGLLPLLHQFREYFMNTYIFIFPVHLTGVWIAHAHVCQWKQLCVYFRWFTCAILNINTLVSTRTCWNGILRAPMLTYGATLQASRWLAVPKITPGNKRRETAVLMSGRVFITVQLVSIYNIFDPEDLLISSTRHNRAHLLRPRGDQKIQGLCFP